MTLRFRHSFQLFPGVRLNVSGGGVSASFGVPGAMINFGKGGVRSTLGIPGSGLSYSHQHWKPGHSEPGSPDGAGPGGVSPPAPGYTPAFAYQQMFQMREINSAAVEDLTSHSLVELHELIAQARAQRQEVENDLKEAGGLLDRDTADLDRRSRSLFRMFYKRRIAELQESVPETEAEIARLEEWKASTHIPLSFETSDDAKRAYGSMVRAFDTLRGSNRIWDVTFDRDVHRVIERSSASRTLDRRPVDVDFASSDLIQFEGRALRFGNVNGEDILIFPGIVLMPRADGAFAIIDLREVQLDFQFQNFIEEEPVPPDSKVVGQTWAKVNKDGSPDRRFNGNYVIPIVVYGKILFTSSGGVKEEYQFSNAEAAAEFARAFEAYKAALSI
ncbi:DUF4236 domain-containing protein [Sphingomonas bacterium]|uniref:DUF4236 domain-containing protein n=1 Tax=Sphingomonas bacterium TaxID=1895847 RepID=UPI00261A9E66|nr:DUF4236 domain-containing protein [Sphingomonas bacterium]MDB5679365.1 hypothetical protein [Sphingomonas bacterium]